MYYTSSINKYVVGIYAIFSLSWGRIWVSAVFHTIKDINIYEYNYVGKYDFSLHVGLHI